MSGKTILFHVNALPSMNVLVNIIQSFTDNTIVRLHSSDSLDDIKVKLAGLPELACLIIIPEFVDHITADSPELAMVKDMRELFPDLPIRWISDDEMADTDLIGKQRGVKVVFIDPEEMERHPGVAHLDVIAKIVPLRDSK